MAEMKQVLVPDIGNYKDVPVIEIMVKVGDVVKAEQSLLTLETDKATMDVPAPFDGVVKEIKIKVGDNISEGTLIFVMEASAGAAPAAVAAKVAPAAAVAAVATPAPAPVPAPTPPAPPLSGGVSAPSPDKGRGGEGFCGKAHASPSVRSFARELGVALAQVKGTAEKGRISKDDVQNFVKAALSQPRAAVGGAAGGMQVLAMPVIDFAKFGAIETQPLSRIKKISGANLHRNWVTIPHVTQFDEADISEIGRAHV